MKKATFLGSTVILSASVMLATPISWTKPVIAQTLESSQIVFNDPKPPNRGSPEGRQRGGGSRKGPCDRYRLLAALVPNPQAIVFANTVSAHPTFWLYIPEPLMPEASIEFALLDAEDSQADYTYKTTLKATEVKSGLVRLSVPPTASPLAKDKPYLWTFTLACNAKPADAVFVQGIIQRVGLTPQQEKQLTTLSPLEQAKFYAANGIWHEALDTLAGQYRLNPQQAQLSTLWKSLLQQVGLQDLAAKPLAN